MQTRKAVAGDTPELAEIFFRAVREGPSPYSEAQRRAWVPHQPEADVFDERLAGLLVWVLEMDDTCAGFIAMTPQGYVDLAFILPACRGRGGFQALCHRVEAHARGHGKNRLWTHASLSAQAAFRSQGFSVIQHETVTRNGENLRRAEMEKILK